MKTLNFTDPHGECVQLWWEGPGMYGVDPLARTPKVISLLSGGALDDRQAAFCWDTPEQACVDMEEAHSGFFPEQLLLETTSVFD